MSKINIVLDSTMLDTFISCECKFNYRFNKNKVTIVKAKPLDRGGLIHVGEECYYTLLRDKISFDERLAESLAAIRKSYFEDSDLPADEYNEILNVYPENKKFWRERDEQLEILEVEKPFFYKLHEDETIVLIMIGKIDLIAIDRLITEEPIVYDHKGYSRTYPADRKANQFCNYSYATSSNYLIVNKIGFQTSLKPFEKHKRIPLSYDPLFLEQWKQNVIIRAYQYLECVQTNKWPMNETSCTKFGRTCEYFDVCDSSGLEAKNYKLEVMFNTSAPWDVSKALGERAK